MMIVTATPRSINGSPAVSILNSKPLKASWCEVSLMKSISWFGFSWVSSFRTSVLFYSNSSRICIA